MADSPIEVNAADGGRQGVAVFAPSTIVTVTVERGASGDEIHFHAGGQGFWIARLLGRLGVPTSMCTVLGGEAGHVARPLIETEQIDLRAVSTASSIGSWVHDRRSGDRRTVAESSQEALSRHEVDELYGATLASALSSGICVLAGPQEKGTIDPDVYRRLADDLSSNDVVVIADLSGDELLAALEGGIDFCKVSDEDLAESAGFEDVDDPMEGLTKLREAGAHHAVITQGAGGLVALAGDEAVEVRSPTLEVVDHRGAGDAFTALVAAAAAWGLDWLDAVRWGAAAGALAVTRRGLATPDRREIHQLLDLIEVGPLR